MAATGKRLIPVELLRRSCRNIKSSAAITHEPPIKSEPSETTKAAKISILKKDVEPIVCDKGQFILVKEEQGICDATKRSQSDQEFKPDGYLEVDCDELDLERTLLGGQSFRWTKSSLDHDQVAFTGVISDSVLQLWRLDDKRVAFRKLNKEGCQHREDLESILADYFQLKYKLVDLYTDWSQRDEHFAKCSQFYKGFRILRQSPVENVFSFICATNNNIKRISQMVEKMCYNFGSNLGYEPYRKFPTVERLAQDDVFSALRYDLGFGYRAKFICETAKMIISLSAASKLSPSDYLLSLRALPYKETCKQLQALPGIGRKVADCICLMSMDHLNSVPIDCHIHEIVCRDYMPNLRNERKTLTEAVHDIIGNYFHTLHGPLAGWATSVLFIAELRHLKQKDDSKGKKRGMKQKGSK